MLTLEASAIANEAQERGLHILEKEMNAVLLYLSNVGTQAALIAGFVFICFTEEVPIVGDDVHPVVSLIGVGFATMSFAAMIYTIVCSTVSSSLGPILALKGHDTSAMRRAGANTASE
jgi:hypothetical protein